MPPQHKNDKNELTRALDFSLGAVVNTLADALSRQDAVVEAILQREAKMKEQMAAFETRLSAAEELATAAALAGGVPTDEVIELLRTVKTSAETIRQHSADIQALKGEVFSHASTQGREQGSSSSELNAPVIMQEWVQEATKHSVEKVGESNAPVVMQELVQEPSKHSVEKEVDGGAGKGGAIASSDTFAKVSVIAALSFKLNHLGEGLKDSMKRWESLCVPLEAEVKALRQQEVLARNESALVAEKIDALAAQTARIEMELQARVLSLSLARDCARDRHRHRLRDGTRSSPPSASQHLAFPIPSPRIASPPPPGRRLPLLASHSLFSHPHPRTHPSNSPLTFPSRKLPLFPLPA